MLTIEQGQTITVKISCDGYGSCRAAFVIKGTECEVDREYIETFMRSVGWVLREDGRTLCRDCATYMP